MSLAVQDCNATLRKKNYEMTRIMVLFDDTTYSINMGKTHEVAELEVLQNNRRRAV